MFLLKEFKETIIADYNKDKKAHKEDKKQSFSTIEFLKNEVERQQAEIERLNKKLLGCRWQLREEVGFLDFLKDSDFMV